MSLLIGRIEIVDPMSWNEPLGEAVQRVGGVPVPGPRNGHSLSPAVELDPETGSARATRLAIRRRMRSLMNNPLARLQAVWVEWDEDDEQSGWYVPGQATIGMSGTDGALVSGLFRIDGLSLELVGRPRTHRRAVLARIRDLRSITEAKDTLSRVYGAAFDGSGSVGSNVTPAPLVWLPSGASDVIAHTGGSPAISGSRTGRASSTVGVVTGLTDLAVVSMEQPAASRLLGDAVIYDRRSETGTPPTTGPHADWEEVHGADWPWSGRVVIDNYLARLHMGATGVATLEYWDGSAYTAYATAYAVATVSAVDYALDTVLSTSVHEWTPDRAVVHLAMSRASQAGTRCDVYLTMQRGWLGPRIEVYPATSGLTVKIVVDPTGNISANTVPTTFTSSVNYGALTATHGVPIAVIHPTTTTTQVGGASGTLVIARAGYVSAHLSRCPTADVATEAAALGADALAGTRYPQTIVPR